MRIKITERAAKIPNFIKNGKIEIPDVFRFNNWPTRSFILAVIFILLDYDLLFVANLYAFKIPVLPQLFGAFVLTFLPGFILLRVLRIRNIDRIANVLLAVGLSLSFNTLLGLVLNTVGLASHSGLISTVPLIAAENIALLSLLLVCYLRNRDCKIQIQLVQIDVFQIIVLLFITSLAILGARLLNNYKLNYCNIVLIILVSLMPFLYKLKQHQPLLIWASALAVLLSMHLVSDYIWGWDINLEYSCANMVLQNHIWNPALSLGVNGLTSVVLLPTIYSIVLHLDLIWVYKIVFPFLFSLVPVGIYYLAKTEFHDDKLAFFSPLVFIFYYGFFKDMADKQYIAELFLILIMLTVVTKNLPFRTILIVPFVLMLPLSHYGISYLLILSFLFTLLVMHIFRIKGNLSTSTVILLLTSATAWYLYTARGTTLISIIGIGQYTIGSLNSILNIEFRSGMAYLTMPDSGWTSVAYKGLNVALLLFVFLGIIKLVTGYLRKNSYLNPVFGLTAIAFSVFLFSQILVPSGLGMDRAVQIALTILAPLAVVGFILMATTIQRGFRLKNRYILNHWPSIFAAFLCISFLFSSGLVNLVSGKPLVYAINTNYNYEWHVYANDEVKSIQWLKTNAGESKVAVFSSSSYATSSRDGSLASGIFPLAELVTIQPNTSNLENSYVFLGKISLYAVNDGHNNVNLTDTPFYSRVLANSDKIFSSNDSAIYLSK
jgi:uncharacterized membrane protein